MLRFCTLQERKPSHKPLFKNFLSFPLLSPPSCCSLPNSHIARGGEEGDNSRERPFFIFPARLFLDFGLAKKRAKKRKPATQLRRCRMKIERVDQKSLFLPSRAGLLNYSLRTVEVGRGGRGWGVRKTQKKFWLFKQGPPPLSTCLVRWSKCDFRLFLFTLL